MRPGEVAGKFACLVKKLITIFALIVQSQILFSQQAHDILVIGQADLVKSNSYGLIKRSQLGIEGDYFIFRKLSLSLGFEHWNNDQFSLAIGSRLYFNEFIFARARALFGAEVGNLGVGFVHDFSHRVALNLVADYYTDDEFAVRAEVVFKFGKNE